MKITAKDRSALLRMAGNIASGAIAAQMLANKDTVETTSLQEILNVSVMSVDIALAIYSDSRIQVNE